MGVVRFFVGLLLLPLCVVATQTLLALMAVAQPDSSSAIPQSTLALGGGYALWILIYFTLPRPTRTYVLAHELTHALWGALMGARVSRLSVSKQKGSVTLSKTNFLITLAPYFFPLYTVLVVGGYYALGFFYDVNHYHLLWLGLVGFTWGFHFTFTIGSLLQHQSDIQLYGRLFSYTVIYTLNIVGIGVWIVLVSPRDWSDVGSYAAFYGREMAAWLARSASQLYHLARQ